MSDPLEQLAILKEKVEQIAAANGLRLEAFAVAPSVPGGPHIAQAVFSIDPDEAFKTSDERVQEDEQKKIDAEFEQMLRLEKITEHESKVEDIRTRGLDLLRELKDGIGLDDPDEPV